MVSQRVLYPLIHHPRPYPLCYDSQSQSAMVTIWRQRFCASGLLQETPGVFKGTAKEEENVPMIHSRSDTELTSTLVSRDLLFTSWVSQPSGWKVLSCLPLPTATFCFQEQHPQEISRGTKTWKDFIISNTITLLFSVCCFSQLTTDSAPSNVMGKR